MGKCILLKSGSGGINPDELTATKEDILINKLAGVSGSDEPVLGTIPNRGAVTQSLNCGNSYTIPSGYHNGSGKVTANSLASQTSANATAGQILSGQTAWINGSKITGSMSNRGAVSQGLGINGSYTIPAGYHNGSGKVTQSIPVQGGSTTIPGTANKTIVAANRYVNGNIIVAGSSNLTAGNIKKGINIFGITGTFQGMVDTPYWLLNTGSWGSLGAPSGGKFTSYPGYLSFAKGTYGYWTTKVVLDSYSKLYILHQGSGTVNQSASITIGASQDWIGANSATYKKRISLSYGAQGAEYLDISSVTGAYFIGFSVTDNYSAKIVSIYLER